VLLIPAIDIRGGRCVRLLRGSFARATSYAEDPVEVARGFAAHGARWIHVVDLDAAEGKGKDNLPVIRRIREAVPSPCRVEAGGGVRSAEQAERLLGTGVDRVVLGTVLVKDPAAVRGWIGRFGPRFAAGIDAVDGRVRVSGWTEDGGRGDTDVAGELAAMGFRWLIYTNISRDGTLAGPDVPRTNAAARAAALPTILSGGIGSAEDIEEAAARKDPLVAGVILGKALYEGRVDLAELFSRFPQGVSLWDPPAD
jgi:phosphoribosylformimino-5-aminoimidazole carboxamide ribotide isomerase